MKTFAIAALLVVNASSAMAATLTCEGGLQASDFDTAISLVANIVTDTELSEVHFQQVDTTSGEVITEAHHAQLEADEGYDSRLELYRDMNRFLLQSEHYHEGNTNLMLPQVLTRRVRFKGYLSSRAGRHSLNCQIQDQ